MAYGTTAGVEAHLPALGTIDGSSTPTSTQVTTWLENGSAQIDAALAGAGYSTPVLDASPTEDLYGLLAGLNDLYAAALAARARGLSSLTGKDETKSETLMRDYRNGLKDLLAGDLSVLGASTRAGRSVKRRRIRSMQMRRTDGYSADAEETEYSV